MKITCQSCQSKYNVADEKVQGKIVKIRCRKCGATIVVQGNGAATTNGSGAAAGSSSATAEGDGQWHVNVGEGEPRTMSISELVDAYNAGVVGQDTFIWTDGMDDWKPLSDVEAVVSALHAGAHAPAAQAQEPAYSAPIAPEPAPMVAAAAPVAVSMAAEPRRAAVVKREARGARDLFGGGVGGEEIQTSAPVNPQMMASAGMDDAASKMTGQRNENSVLFSLAVLTKDAGERPEEPAPRSTGKSSDDSGLIDLKALAAKAESMRPAAGAENNAFASPLGLGGTPLGAPLGVLGSPLGEAPQKSKLPLYIGGGAGVVLLLVLGIVIGVKVAGGNAAAPEASAMTSTAPTASATAEPSATASAAPEASASAAPSASVAAKPKPAGGGTYHAPSGGGAKPAGGGTAATTGAAGGAATAATPPPPKKAGSDCGCNGDLMCLMKCSTH